ncbi:MAG: SAM-dependent methyltransferase [Clostridia bacterium]|nr:SAM-dependent methyltransferase [Clostridia bacterium]
MFFDKKISLDPRLSKIAEMLGTCEKCADIGSDHGRLGAFLLQNGQCGKVFLTDISAPSLDKARKLCALIGFKDEVEFRVGDGALALTEKVDAVVIAGMGGETIADIIENSDGRLDGAVLLLQPNVAAPQLRRRLNNAGWMIVDEALPKDGRRIYPIIKAVQGKQQLTEAEAEAGPVILKNKPETLREYASFRIRVAGKALAGAENGAAEEQISALRREIAIWEDIEKCL